MFNDAPDRQLGFLDLYVWKTAKTADLSVAQDNVTDDGEAACDQTSLSRHTDGKLNGKC